MKKAWKIVSTVTLCLFALGCICFGLSVLMDANLVRIADAVFAKYDIASMYAQAQSTIAQIQTLLPM